MTAIGTDTIASLTTSYTYSSGNPVIFNTVSYPGLIASGTPACSYNTTNGLFTINVKGVYTVNVYVTTNAGNSATIGLQGSLSINGVNKVQGSTQSGLVGPNGAPNFCGVWCTIDDQFNIGDVIFFDIILAGISTTTFIAGTVYCNMGVTLL